jgi:hypothetical protein
VGDDGADRAALVAELRGRLLPSAVRAIAPAGAGGELTPLLEGRTLVDGRPTAYVCEHFACRLPVTDPEALRAEIDRAAGSGERGGG